MDQYYYLEAQNWTKNDKPLNTPPIPVGRDFFYLVQLNVDQLLKAFQNIRLKKIAFHLTNYEEISRILY
jgi:hypothetical protein